MTKSYVALLISALSLVGFNDASLADDDDHAPYTSANQVNSTEKALYNEECGGCHFAYPPQMLPQRSWDKILDTLDSHFGDVASLDAATTETLRLFLAENSAEHSHSRRAQKILRSFGDRTPVRITGTPFFMANHDEVPLRLVLGNDQVRSFSNCTACHSRAEQGSFSEREIRIAGYGKWDD